MSGALFNEPGTWETLKAARRAATEPDEVVPVSAFLACRVLPAISPSEQRVLLGLWKVRDHTTCVVRVAIARGPDVLGMNPQTFTRALRGLVRRGLVEERGPAEGEMLDVLVVLPEYRIDDKGRFFYLGSPGLNRPDSGETGGKTAKQAAPSQGTKETRARCLPGREGDTQGGYADWRSAFADVPAIKRVGWSFFAEWGMPTHEIERLKALGVTIAEAAHAAGDLAGDYRIRSGWAALAGRLAKRRQQQGFQPSPGREVARLQSIREKRLGGGHPLEVRAWVGVGQCRP